MKRAAFGVQMHSGWGVLMAVSGAPDAIEILARRRIVTADREMPGAIQPYHYAMNLKLPESDKHLAKCAAASTRLAVAAIGDLVAELNARDFHIVGSAVLLASGRSLPPLEKILASHPLIHTAEGEFFRHTVSQACEDLQTPARGSGRGGSKSGRKVKSGMQPAGSRAASQALERPSAHPGRRIIK